MTQPSSNTTSRLIQTESFQLACLTCGNEKSEKLAIIIPGRMDTKDYAHCVSHIEYLGDNGFFAVAFDPPGTWNSPGGTELCTTTNYIKAIHELIEKFGNKPTVLLGHSRGGASAIMAGVTHSSTIAIVCIMGSYGPPTAPDPDDIKRGFLIEKRDLPPGTSKTKERREFILHMNYFKDGEKYNPAESLKQFNKPKLLICGTRDKFTEPEEVADVFKNISDPKMMCGLNSEHDYRYQPDIIEKVNAIIGEFIYKYL